LQNLPTLAAALGAAFVRDRAVTGRQQCVIDLAAIKPFGHDCRPDLANGHTRFAAGRTTARAAPYSRE